jgi:hypothetical protein
MRSGLALARAATFSHCLDSIKPYRWDVVGDAGNVVDERGDDWDVSAGASSPDSILGRLDGREASIFMVVIPLDFQQQLHQHAAIREGTGY